MNAKMSELQLNASYFIFFMEVGWWVPNILFIVFVVFFKDSQDILQGISKLDYLVKLSIFQRYKVAPSRLSVGSSEAYTINDSY